MIALDLLLRWMHLLSAIVLVGGTIFMRCAYVPAGPTEPLAAEVRRRWAKLVMATSGLLLLSGLVNFVIIMQRYTISEKFPGNIYQMVFGIKFLLALAVFFLSSALAGRSAMAQSLRRREAMWLTLNAILAVSVVLLGGIMKLAARSEKPSLFMRPAQPVVSSLEWHDAGREALPAFSEPG
jgi:putative copper export protein